MVNHKNENKLNYALKNREWVTSKENYKLAFNKNLIKYLNFRPVMVKCTDERYSSIRKAARSLVLKYPKVKKI